MINQNTQFQIDTQFSIQLIKIQMENKNKIWVGENISKNYFVINVGEFF